MIKKTQSKIIVPLLVIVVAIFVILITLHFLQNKNRQIQLESSQSQLQSLTQQAQSLQQLDFSTEHRLSRFDAQSQLTNLENETNQLLDKVSRLPDPTLPTQIKTLQAQFPAIRDHLQGVVHLDPDQTPFYHPHLALTNFQPLHIHLINGGESAFFIDRVHSQGLILDLATKRYQPFALQYTPLPPSVTNSSITQITQNQILNTPLSSLEEIRSADLDPDLIRQTKHFISSESNTYLFTLDQIYRLPNPTTTSSSTSQTTAWLNYGQVIPHSDEIADLAVNEDLWLTTTNGQLFKLSKGSVQEVAFPDEFRLSANQLNSIQYPLQMALDPNNNDQLYLLSGQSGHLFAVNLASREVERDYVGDSLKGARDFVYNSTDQSFLVLHESGAVYKVDHH